VTIQGASVSRVMWTFLIHVTVNNSGWNCWMLVMYYLI